MELVNGHRKWNYLNRKWNYFNPFQTLEQKTSFRNLMFIMCKYSISRLVNSKWNYLNRKWNYVSQFQSSDQKSLEKHDVHLIQGA